MATLTITTTAQQDQRIIAAFRDRLNDPTAGAAEVKADVINYMKGVVHSYETREAANAAADAVVPMPDPS